jgi:CRP-like cAMP-binding protein
VLVQSPVELERAGRSTPDAKGTGTAELVHRIPLFAGVDPAIVRHLSAVAQLRHYERGEELWHAGELPSALPIVHSGLVKVVRPTCGGQNAICGLFGRPTPLGQVALLKGTP